MRWSVLLISLVALGLAGCASNKVTTIEVESPGAYMLDTGDVLRVTVYGDETLTNSYAVTDKGTISLPLAGQVAVRGQSLVTVERMIREVLANGYMINPQVSVEVAAYRPFFIEGAVTASGQYPYVYGMTARAAVATAGGFAQYAEQRRVTVYRRLGKTVTKLQLTLDNLIMPGDTVVVAERWL